GDVVDISDVFDDTATTPLAVTDDGSNNAKLTVFDSGDNPIGSVTFENIDFDTLDTSDPLNDLASLVDIDTDGDGSGDI
ncbi:MAG: hypothetical protein N2B58_05990, partial [Desulfobacterales bacterium]